MCCQVSAATQRVQWNVSMGMCWIHEQTEKTEETWRKKSPSVLFINHKSHTNWCNIQLQLYSQQTAPNYQTAGFNNIHLKCAQQNCLDTALILHCALILEPIQNVGINWQWVSRPAASFVNNWQPFTKNMISSPHCNCKNMTAGLPLLFSVSAVNSNYINYPLSSFDSNIDG